MLKNHFKISNGGVGICVTELGPEACGGSNLTLPPFQMRKPRLTWGKRLAQGHTAGVPTQDL